MDWVSPGLPWEEEKLCWKVGFTLDWKYSARSPKKAGSQSDYLSWAESKALCDRKWGRLSNTLIRLCYRNVHLCKQVWVCAVLFLSLHWLSSGAGVFWFAWLLLRGNAFCEVWRSACIVPGHPSTGVPGMAWSWVCRRGQSVLVGYIEAAGSRQQIAQVWYSCLASCNRSALSALSPSLAPYCANPLSFLCALALVGLPYLEHSA